MDHPPTRGFECGTASLEAAGGRPCGSRASAGSLAAHRTIPDRLRALAARHPERLALFDAETSLTYGELDRAVDSAAISVLDELGDTPAAVLLVAGVDAASVVAALGVMRAGKHFVAVEPALPATRITGIAQDCAASLLLAGAGHEALARECAGHGRRVLCMQSVAERDADCPLPALAPRLVALLNYTSGSTGRPKGVVHTHGSALSQATRYADAFLLGDADRHAGFGSLAWAGSCWDAFGPLCVGACAGVYDVRRHGLDALPGWIEQSGATVLSGMVVVRAVARQFPQRRFEKVRLIQLGGDTVYGTDVQACARAFPNAFVAVGFGTTETGRALQHFVAPGVDRFPEVMPIGFPLPGMCAWIIDETGKQTPPGTVGEIVVQADDLAEGYHGEPALTARKFRRDLPYGEAPVYFTGDLGLQLPDGALLNIGRKDFQIKIRGYQVPAGEVEALLLASPGVREACVVVQRQPPGQEMLVAFVVRDAVPVPAPEELIAHLRGSLPDYMVPQRIIELGALPKTPTGKADRRAMQGLETAPTEPLAGRLAPRTPVEARIAGIWCEVLGIDRVGVDEDFLALGGDSLRATQVASRVLRSFGLTLPLSQLLARPTVADMAEFVAAYTADASAAAAIVPLARRS